MENMGVFHIFIFSYLALHFTHQFFFYVFMDKTSSFWNMLLVFLTSPVSFLLALASVLPNLGE